MQHVGVNSGGILRLEVGFFICFWGIFCFKNLGWFLKVQWQHCGPFSFCRNPRVWQTDRQTDGHTAFSSLDRVLCSDVKSVINNIVLNAYTWRAPAQERSKTQHPITAVIINDVNFLQTEITYGIRLIQW